MSNVHLLPSRLALNSLEGCNQDADCGPSFACMINSTWVGDPGVIYKRHNDEPRSGVYVDDIQPNISGFSSFCSCDQTFHWTGFDCTEYGPSWYFEVLWIFSAIFIGTCVTLASAYNLKRTIMLNGNKFRLDSVGKSVIYLGLAGIFLILSASLRVADAFDPKTRVLITSKLTGRTSRVPPNASNWTFMNVFAGVATVIAIMQVVYCWIEIVQKMKTLGTFSTRAIWTSRIIIFLEILLFVIALALVVLGKPVDAFMVCIPFILFTVGSSLYGMYRMTGMLKTSMSDFKSISKKTDDGQIKALIYRIRLCALGILVLSFPCIFGIVIIYLGAAKKVPFQAQTPSGSFDRPYMIGNYLAEYTYLPLVQLNILIYLNGLISSRIQRRQRIAIHGPDAETNSNSGQSNHVVAVVSAPREETSGYTDSNTFVVPASHD